MCDIVSMCLFPFMLAESNIRAAKCSSILSSVRLSVVHYINVENYFFENKF